MPKLTDLPFQAAAKIQEYAERGSAELHYARKMFEAGALKLEPPQNIAAFVADIRRWGEFGMLPALNARRTPNSKAVVDDDGEITFKELDDAAHAVANGLLAMGVRGGDGVAILARNHRWVLVALYGAAKVGSGPAQQRVLRAADQGGLRARGRQTDHLRRRVHRLRFTGRPAAGQAACAGHQPRQGGVVGQYRRDAGRPHRAQQQRAGAEGDETFVDHHPDERDTGTPKGANRSTPPSPGADGGPVRAFKANEGRRHPR